MAEKIVASIKINVPLRDKSNDLAFHPAMSQISPV